MATRFANARALAVKQILKNGVTATYRVKGTTLVNPAEPWLGFTGDVDLSIPIVFVGFTRDEIATGLIEVGDQKALVAADNIPGVDPKTSDLIIFEGRELHVINFTAVRPNGERIFFALQVRD